MVTRKSPVVRIAVAAMLVVLGLALVPVALADKGGNHGGGNNASRGGYSITLDKAGPYTFGESVIVSTDTPVYPDGAGPYIGLRCLQNGEMVGSDVHAGFLGGLNYAMPFYFGPSQIWSGGAADCTFTVYHSSSNKIVEDAVLTVHVGG